MAQTNGKESQAEQVEQERKFLGGLLEGLSVPQVAAGALAAVTSMLLSSKIGIAGSVIGVAVGSVVSTLSSQIYKQFLQASADKLRELSPVSDAGVGSAGASAGEVPAAGDASATRVMDPAATRLMSQVGDAGASVLPGRAGETQVLDPVATRVMAPAAAGVQGAGSVAAAGAAASEGPTAGETPTRTVDDLRAEGETGVLRGRAEHLRRQRVQRGVIVVSVVSALVAVAVSAFVIDLVTAGEGMGAKTEPLFGSATTSQSVDSDSAKPSKQQTVQDNAAASQQSEQGSGSADPVHQDSATSASGSESSNAGQSGSASDSTSGSSASSGASSSGSSLGSSTASGSQNSAASGSGGDSSGGSSSGASSAGGSSTSSSATGGATSADSGSGTSSSASGTSTGTPSSANAS